MSGVIDRIRKSLVRKKREAVEGNFPRYRDLLDRVSREDPEIDPSEVSEILELNGLTIDDLARDSETFRKRLEWSRLRSDAEVAKIELAKDSQVLDGLKEELRKAKETLEPKIRETAQRMQAIHFRITSGAVDHDLVRTCLDPSLRNRVAEIDAEIREKLAAIDSIRSMADDSAVSVAGDRVRKWEDNDRNSWGKNAYVRRQLRYWRGIFDNYRDRKDSRDGMIAELEAEVRRLNLEREQVQQRMLTP